MTREDEIIQRAETYTQAIYNSLDNFLREDVTDAYIDGARWADENPDPNDKEITKKEVINRACEWLEDNLFNYLWYDNEATNFTVNDVINDFKKAMEE